jgi:hypothetical protein
MAHKATFWDFVKSPWRNKLAVFVLALLLPIALFGIFLTWVVDRIFDFVNLIASWVQKWW